MDNLIIAGGMTYTFTKALGGKVGISICEDDKLELALELLEKAKKNGVNMGLAVDAKIADVAKIDAEIEALKARQKAVEDLQSDRNLPVHLLNELVVQLPDGVYVESLKQQDQTVQIQGIAQSNERVSELLNSLATKTPWLSKPELVEVVGTTTQINAKEKKRVSSFNLRFRLVRSSEMEQPAAGEKKK